MPPAGGPGALVPLRMHCSIAWRTIEVPGRYGRCLDRRGAHQLLAGDIRVPDQLLSPQSQ